MFSEKGKTCCLCGCLAKQVHHDCYNEQALTGEDLEHLYPICKECHRGLEFSCKGKKLTFRTVSRRFRKILNRRKAISNPK